MKLKGISQRNGKWRAQFRINNATQHLGYFDDPKEAHWAWLRAVRDSGLVEPRWGQVDHLNKVRIRFNYRILITGCYDTPDEAMKALRFVVKPIAPSTPRQTHNLPTGVAPSGKRYRAKIHAYQEDKHLGTFDTPEEAHKAYVRAARKLGRDVIDETTTDKEQDS